MDEDIKPYLVSYKEDEYMGFREENGWKLIPINEDYTKQTGEPFYVEGEPVEIKNHMLFPPETEF